MDIYLNFQKVVDNAA